MDMTWPSGSDAWTELDQILGQAPPEARWKSVEALSASFSGARIGTWQFDVTTREWQYDHTVGEIFDVRPGERSAFERVHEEDRASVRAAFVQCLQTGVVTEFEMRAIAGDGSCRWVHVLVQPIAADCRDRPVLAGIALDVTRRKQAEEALRESERQLRAIVDNLPGIAYRCSLTKPRRIVFISDGIERLTGYEADDFMLRGLNCATLIHPDDAERVQEEVARAIKGRERYSVEYRIFHKSGTVRWVQETGGVASDGSDEPPFLEGFIGDIHDRKLAEEDRRLADQRYRLINQAVTDGVWELDVSTNRLMVNEAFSAAFGYSEGEVGLDGSWWLDKVHPDDRDRLMGRLYLVLTQGGTHYLSEHRFRRSDGTYAEVYACCYILRDESGAPVRMLGALQDLTARKLADAALRESESTNRSIIEATTDCVKLIDLDGTLQFINGSGLQLLELDSADQVLGKPWEAMVPPAAASLVREAMDAAKNGGIGRFSTQAPTSTGRPKWWEIVVSPVVGSDGEVKRLVAISRDVSEQRKAAEELLRAASLDPLTGLANRAFFQEKLADLASDSTSGTAGIMLLDLDEFKQLNDTLGHDAGDALLKTLADRLRATCSDAALVARLGGDEFSVLFGDCGGAEAMAARAAKILAVLREPVVHCGRILDCHATIGAAIFPQDGSTPAELLKSADLALYAAKSNRRGGYMAFEPRHRAEMEARSAMIRQARAAVRDGAILPHYQPKIALDTGSIIGFEALLRWRDESLTLQRPAGISAAFDDLELATAISDAMVEQVIGDMRAWLDRGIDFGHVAINASAAEFRRDDFAEGLLASLDRCEVPPNRLQLEVTETVFLGRGAEYVERALHALSEAGISIALDDFGTGYASLRHLKQFPVHVIKIDQSFVRNMSSGREDTAIIEAVLNLGRSLGMGVVAEGIESESQESHLRSLGCRFGQGYLYSEAVPSDKVPELIANWVSRTGLKRSVTSRQAAAIFSAPSGLIGRDCGVGLRRRA
jgi:diguanylate cyclase (GGDEF)-like protein/PAS domain S-box-containing protein